MLLFRQTRLAFEARYTPPLSKKAAAEQQSRKAARSHSRGREGEARAASDNEEGRRTRDSSIDSTKEIDTERLIRRKTSSGFFNTTKKIASFASDKRVADNIIAPSTSESSARIASSSSSTSQRRSKRGTPTRASVSGNRSLMRKNETDGQSDREKFGESDEVPSSKRQNFVPTTDVDDPDDSSDDEDELCIHTQLQSQAKSVPDESKVVTELSGEERKVSLGRAFDSDSEDEKQMLLDVEQNIANLEKSMSVQEKMVNAGLKSKGESSPDTPRKRYDIKKSNLFFYHKEQNGIYFNDFYNLLSFIN